MHVYIYISTLTNNWQVEVESIYLNSLQKAIADEGKGWSLDCLNSKIWIHNHEHIVQKGICIVMDLPCKSVQKFCQEYDINSKLQRNILTNL